MSFLIPYSSSYVTLICTNFQNFWVNFYGNIFFFYNLRYLNVIFIISYSFVYDWSSLKPHFYKCISRNKENL